MEAKKITMKTKTSIFCALFLTGSITYAQGIIDGFYSAPGNISLTASYTATAYDEYFVERKRSVRYLSTIKLRRIFSVSMPNMG